VIQTRTSTHSQLKKAFALLGKNRKADAQLIFDELQPDEISDTDTTAQYGKLALLLGENAHAINSLYKATEAAPDNAGYLDLFAQALIENGNTTRPMELLQRAIQLDPELPGPYLRLAILEMEKLDFKAAVPLLEKAIQLKPGDPLAYAHMVIALRYTDRHEEALKYAQKLLRLVPNNPANHEIMGRVLIELGKQDDAMPHLEKAIRLDRTYGPAYNSLSSIKKFTLDDKKFIDQCEAALQLSMSPVNRSHIHFSLGKIYDDCKLWEQAFEHYRQGNLLSKSAIADNSSVTKRFNKTRKSYNRKFIDKTRNLGNDSEIPVFVVGMPRSGTTLIEQIVASHPDGAAAGELTAIHNIEMQICPDQLLSSYDKKLHENLTPELIHEYAEGYLQVLRKNREQANRIVDKMPDNFLYLGLINLLFPNAHIIHAVRNPLDTCLSCYFQPFTHIKWAHDLESIADRYRLYRKAMDHWNSTLTAGRITEVRYELLIEDPENQIRQLIDSCGLPWDDQCLSFHEKKRAIVTASVWQARQPLYKSSRKRWSHYGKFLEVLANRLSDYLDDEDIEELQKQGLRISRKWYRRFSI